MNILQDELENIDSSGDAEVDTNIESALTVFLTGLKDLSSERDHSLKTMIVSLDQPCEYSGIQPSFWTLQDHLVCVLVMEVVLLLSSQ